MVRRRRTLYSHVPIEPPSIVLLWLLRLLVPLGGYRNFITSHGFGNDALADVIGLGEWVSPEAYEFDQQAALSGWSSTATTHGLSAIILQRATLVVSVPAQLAFTMNSL